MSFFSAVLFLLVVYSAGRLLRPNEHLAGARVILRTLLAMLILAGESAVILLGLLLLLAVLAMVGNAFPGLDITAGVLEFNPSSMMLPVLFVLCVSGILACRFHKRLQRRFPKLALTAEEVDFSEYIIQWLTIYLTVYQLVFDSLSDLAAEIASGENMRVLVDSVLSPDNINLTVLPLLFSTWVAIALEKIQNNHNPISPAKHAKSDSATATGTGTGTGTAANTDTADNTNTDKQ